jgi:hypothetical protein
MKKFILRSAVSLLTVSMVFTACKKDKEEPSEDFVAVDSQVVGQMESDDVVAMAEAVMADNNSGMRTDGTTEVQANDYCGATVTLVPKGSNATGNIVIDFGSGKECQGKTRKGKIIIDFTGKYFEAGTTQTLTFANYYVNNVKVEGKKVFTHAIDNSKFITHIIVTNGKITFADGSKAEWNSDRYRTWDTKGTPTNPADDEFSVIGTASGKTKEDKNYTVTITSPILLKAACFETSGWVPVSGTLEVTPDSKLKRTIDYGNGSCDRTFTATIAGKTYTRSIQ